MALKDSKNPARSFSAILSQLADSEHPLSIAGLYLLSDISSEDVAALEAIWPSIQTVRRRQIMSLLNEISEASFEVDFQRVAQHLGLTDVDSDVRRTAIEALWEAEDAALLESFARLLSADPAPVVRAAAAAALGRFVLLDELDKLPGRAEGRAPEALFAALDADAGEPDVQRRTVESLGFSSDPRVPDVIAHAYRSPDERTRASAVVAMGRSADKRWVPTILKELRSESPQMRYEAAHAAGELEARRAVPRLIVLTDDDDHDVQGAAISALGEIGGSTARRHLEALSEGRDAAVAEAADEALETLAMADVGSGLVLLDLDEDDDEDIDDVDDVDDVDEFLAGLAGRNGDDHA